MAKAKVTKVCETCGEVFTPWPHRPGQFCSRRCRYQQTPLERIWARVQRGEPDQCWPWLGYRNPRGYGMVGIVGGNNQLVHRAVYALTISPIQNGLCVCHTCDNPPCCNPRHLWLGTMADNTADMIAKGRQNRVTKVRGEAVHGAKLNAEMVRAIRVASGTLTAIAAQFGVTQSSVSQIRSRKTWRHVI